MPKTSTVAATEEEALIRQHLPLVHHVVASVRGRLPNHVNADDLTSAAMNGLFRAARSFDPERGVPFAAYATTRMRGAILDELRGSDWASRSVRAKARSLQDAAERDGASLDQAAEAAGLSADEARQVIADVQRASVLSFETFLSTESTGALPVEHATPEADLLDREQHGYLHDAVRALPARLRTVVVGSFFEDRLMADLAEELGVSESRISHMRAEAIALIREAMTRSLERDADATDELPKGVAARRRAAYVEAVATASDYRSRLDSRLPAAVAVPA